MLWPEPPAACACRSQTCRPSLPKKKSPREYALTTSTSQVTSAASYSPPTPGANAPLSFKSAPPSLARPLSASASTSRSSTSPSRYIRASRASPPSCTRTSSSPPTSRASPCRPSAGIAGAAGHSKPKLQKTGSQAIIAGVVLQLVVLAAFGTLGLNHLVRVARWMRKARGPRLRGSGRLAWPQL